MLPNSYHLLNIEKKIELNFEKNIHKNIPSCLSVKSYLDNEHPPHIS